MPKTVDHRQRRREIAAAVSRVAIDRGLQGVSFREVAAEAGVSVALIQHYFGSKERLLIGTLEIQSEHFAGLIAERLGRLHPQSGPAERLRTIAASFVPTDEESRGAMLLYHAFAGAALADPRLRQAEAFRNADSLVEVMARELALARESKGDTLLVDPNDDAMTILCLVLGLSLATLLERMTPEQAVNILEAHLGRLLGRGQRSGEPTATG